MPKTIPLSKPLKGHKGPIDKVVMREPTYSEYLEHGEPFVYLPLKEGGWFRSDSTDVIVAYARILVIEPKDQLLLEQGGLELARQIKEAVLGFFLPAAVDNEA